MASSAATCFGFFLLTTGNTILAIRIRSRAAADAAATAAFVVASYAWSLVLLFYCLRLFETSPTGSAAKERARAGVWLTTTTTLLTAMLLYEYNSGIVGPPVVVVGGGALVLILCLLREGLGGQYAALFKMGVAVVACDSALAHHGSRGGDDGTSLPFVLVAYVGFLTLTLLFLRRFDARARGAEQ